MIRDNFYESAPTAPQVPGIPGVQSAPPAIPNFPSPGFPTYYQHDGRPVLPPIESQPQSQPQSISQDATRTRGSSKQDFKRSYKACLNCRMRKVRCDLGPLAHPRDPPCARCKRERKQCVFTESRRGGATNVIAGRVRKLANSATGSASNSATGSTNSTGSVTTIAISAASATATSPLIIQQSFINNQPVPKPGNKLETTRDALEFLARAAGTVMKLETPNTGNGTPQGAGGAVPFPSGGSLPPINAGFGFGTNINNSATATATGIATQPPVHPTGLGYPIPSINATTAVNLHPIPARIPELGNPGPHFSASNITPNPGFHSGLSSASDCATGFGLLTPTEASDLVALFFQALHPFFPYIPRQLHSLPALSRYPILLCCILTIASRYGCLAEPHGNSGGAVRNEFGPQQAAEAARDTAELPNSSRLCQKCRSSTCTKSDRNIRIHEQLWTICQQMISQSVWAEASTRSVGTVYAFILFTEWNPRAIHSQGRDFGNMGVSSAHPPASEQFAGLGAARRSDRMAWMMIGTAIRLAQDMGFMRSSLKVFLATHVAETYQAISMGRRSMLAESLAGFEIAGEAQSEAEAESEAESEAEAEAEVEAGNEAQNERGELEGKESGSVGGSARGSARGSVGGSSDKCTINPEDFLPGDTDLDIPASLPKFAAPHQAKIEILQILQRAFESLYNSEAETPPRQSLKVLDLLGSAAEQWKARHHKLLAEPNSYSVDAILLREALLFDYHYTALYIFSISLSLGTEPGNLRFTELHKTARHLHSAYRAARDCLELAGRVNRMKMLRWMPTPWVKRIVRAVAFLVKLYQTLLAEERNGDRGGAVSVFSLVEVAAEEIRPLIRRAAETLKEAAIDELHLCARYSVIVEYLYEQMESVPDAETAEEDGRPVPKADAEVAGNAGAAGTAGTAGTAGIAGNADAAGAAGSAGSTSGAEENNTKEGDVLNDSTDYFSLFDWFQKNDASVGLSFVDPLTDMLEYSISGMQKTDKWG